jgi:hypothetical protein
MAKKHAGLMALAFVALLIVGCGGGDSKDESSSPSTSASATQDSSKCDAAVKAANADPDAVGVTARQNVSAIQTNCTRRQFDKIAAQIYKSDPDGLFGVSPPKEWIDLVCGASDGSGKKAGLLVCQ